MTDSKVDHPSYYGGKNDPYEAIKVIEAWGLDFCLGNAIKYISRAGKKDPECLLQDLNKAKWYLEHEIESVKRQQKIQIADEFKHIGYNLPKETDNVNVKLENRYIGKYILIHNYDDTSNVYYVLYVTRILINSSNQLDLGGIEAQFLSNSRTYQITYPAHAFDEEPYRSFFIVPEKDLGSYGAMLCNMEWVVPFYNAVNIYQHKKDKL